MNRDTSNGRKVGRKVFSQFPVPLDEQLRTLFVKGLPLGMPDNAVLPALEMIPGLEVFVRVHQVNGLPASHAFVRYSTGQAIKVAMEILPKVKYYENDENKRQSLLYHEKEVTDVDSLSLSGESKETNMGKEDINKNDIKREENGAAKVNGLSSKKSGSVETPDLAKEKNDTQEVQLSVYSEENTDRWISLTYKNVTVQSVTRIPPDNLARQMSNIFISWLKSGGVARTSANSDNNSSFLHLDDINGSNNNDINDSSKEISSSNSGDISDLAVEFPDADLELIKKEIKQFRDQSLSFERKKMAAEEEYEKLRSQRAQEAAARTLQKAGDNGITFRSSINNEQNEIYDFSDEEKYPVGEDDSKLEKVNEAKRLEKLDKKFEQEEKRWINRERARADALERERIKDETRDSRVSDARSRDLTRYSLFRDDEERSLSSLEYYYDHAGWVKARMHFRAREVAAEKADEEAESLEFVSEQNKTLSKNEMLTSKLPTGSANKISLSLSAAATRRNTESESLSKKFVNSNDEQLLWQADEDEEKKPLKSLRLPKPRPELPDDSDQLFKWSVKWEKLNDNILEDIIRPFVTTNIIEFLGIQEDDLIDFVVQHVKNHKSAESLLEELEITLDEDAKVFTDRLWRVLIEELEMS